VVCVEVFSLSEPEGKAMLIDEIRIQSAPNTAVNVSKQHTYFYRGYARFVRQALHKRPFQRFLRWLLQRENIDWNRITDVQIRVYPRQKQNGNHLAGRWRGDGNISLFPKHYTSYRKLVAKHGPRIARSYVKSRARAALIHEILHAKYHSDEARVRRLTERYFTRYARHPMTEPVDSRVPEMLFKEK
jgi:hypothetical protein